MVDDLEEEAYHMRDLTGESDSRNDNYFKRYHLRISKKENEIIKFMQRANLVGRICVQYNLPAGDPCWMSEKIMSYV